MRFWLILLMMGCFSGYMYGEDAAAPAALDTSGAIISDAFTVKVKEAGGRVDFIFGKDRDFAQCHASTVVQMKDGSLLAAWFGGTREHNPDVAIWTSRFADNAWSAPVKRAKIEESAHWNPVLFTDAEGETHLFFKVGPEIDFWQTFWMTTKDNGASWTKPVELVAGDKGGRGPVKNKPIQLSDGSWLAPASTEFEGWKPFADRSEDRGRTWTRSAYFVQDTQVLPGKGAIQPTLWESSPGSVHALVRTCGGKIWRSDSSDYGRTWTPLYATGLPNNNSGIDVVGLKDGRIFLIFNPVGEGGIRTPLDLAVSKDNGRTFKVIAHLEEEPDPKSEFSYPAIIATKQGLVVTYTFKRNNVRCWQVPWSLLPE